MVNYTAEGRKKTTLEDLKIKGNIPGNISLVFSEKNILFTILDYCFFTDTLLVSFKNTILSLVPWKVFGCTTSSVSIFNG